MTNNNLSKSSRRRIPKKSDHTLKILSSRCVNKCIIIKYTYYGRTRPRRSLKIIKLSIMRDGQTSDTMSKRNWEKKCLKINHRCGRHSQSGIALGIAYSAETRRRYRKPTRKSPQCYDIGAVQKGPADKDIRVGRRTIGTRNERHATAHKTEIGPRNYIGGGGVGGGYRAARRDAFNPVRKIPTVVPGGYPENYYTRHTHTHERARSRK